MRPVLFRRWGLAIPSYSVMLSVGLVAGVAAGNVAAHKAGLDAFRVYIATCILVVPALIGARLLYVASHWQIYRRDLSRIWRRGEGGLAQYGGLVLAVVLSAPVLAALQLPWGAFWDVAVFTILVGMISARIGCLLSGCCAGRPSKSWLSVYLPNSMGVWERRIPTQGLELGWAALLLVVAVSVWPRLPFAGALFLIASASYGAGRLVLESTRERPLGTSRFTIHHRILAVIILLSVAALAASWPE